MPRPIARRKTKKGFAKRFKITGSGKKVKRTQAGRRHILEKKSHKRKRQLAGPALVHKTDLKRVFEAMPFS